MRSIWGGESGREIKRIEPSHISFVLDGGGFGNGGSGHWGADQIMQDRIFRKSDWDPLERGAGSREGALSIMIGIAARRSIEQKRPFRIEELVKL